MSGAQAWTCMMALAATLAGCNDEPKRPLGASCTHDSQCESGRCVNGVCVAPEPGDTATFPDADAGGELPGETGGDTSANLTVVPRAHGNDAVARFEFVSDPPGATFECSLDGADFVPCTSPFEVTTGEGQHTLVIRVIWADGSAEETTLTYTWEVDLTAPTTTLASVPPAVDNSAEVAFHFEVSEAATSSCRLDLASWQPCTSPHVVSELGDGPHVFEVVSTDAAGNVEDPPATHRWRIDTGTPDTRIDSGPDPLVADTEATFAFTSPNAVEADFECALDAEDFAPCASPWRIVDLADGEHTFAVRAVNAVGAVDPTPAEWTWVVDTTEPITGACGSANGGSTLTAPTSGLCAAGAASEVSGSGPFGWTCAGSGGGGSATCSADRSCDASALAWAVDASRCSATTAVTAHGERLVAVDDSQPTTGSQTFDCYQGTWAAAGAGTCTTATAAACGVAHGGSTNGAPASGLCASGVASAVDGSGPYTWTCTGAGGDVASCASNRGCSGATVDWTVGTNACSGNVPASSHGASEEASDATLPTSGRQTVTCDQGTWRATVQGTCVAAQDGACGTAAGGSTTSAPTTGLCAGGTASSVAGSGPYTWTCAGADGGVGASCTSNRSCVATTETWSVGDSTCSAAVATTEHGDTESVTDATLPTTGSETFGCDQGRWQAAGDGTCVTAADAACGAANGGSTASAPVVGLCASGTASAVSGDGPYTWTCAGAAGGSSASCASNRSCLGGAMSWSVGGSACSGTILASDHGDGESVIDGVLPTTGSQGYECAQGVWLQSGTSVCVTAEDGDCGPADGDSTVGVPLAADLCHGGTPSSVTGDGPYSWTCAGIDGGVDASCSSNRSCAAQAVQWTVGDSACGGDVATTDDGDEDAVSDATLPTTGSQTFACTQGSWSESGTGACVTAVDAACGAADGGSTASAPTSGLCESGSASSVSGTGPFTWTCSGIDGGDDASCSSNRSCATATVQWTEGQVACSGQVDAASHGAEDAANDATAPTAGSQTFTCAQGAWTESGTAICYNVIDGACGAADGGSTTSAPTGGLCAAGTASVVSGSGPYTWSCASTNGGTTDFCTSNRSCAGTTQSWIVDDSQCSASVTTTAHGASATASDAGLPTTGSRDYACSQGTWSGSGTGTCVTAVDGACGAADGGSTTAKPTTNLCSVGSASSVAGTGPWTWTCSGTNGGANDSCSSNRSCTTASRTWTISNTTCDGSVPAGAHGVTKKADDVTEPTVGSQDYLCSQGAWSASGTGTCVTVVHGACGSADGGSTTSAPTTNLCSSGTASSVTGTGPYDWTCAGSNGGTSDTCSSNRSCTTTSQTWIVGNYTCGATTTAVSHGGSRTAVDSIEPTVGSRTYDCSQGTWTGSGTGTCVAVVHGVCGSADGGSTTSKPTTNLCSSGTPSTVTGTGPWDWTCAGSNGGTSDNCSSNRSCVATTQTWYFDNNGCTATAPGSSHGVTAQADDKTAPDRGSQLFDCNQGNWSPNGTGSCVRLEIIPPSPEDGASFSFLQDITYYFSVTGNSTSVQCRIYKNGSPVAYTTCKDAFKRAITTDNNNYWVFQLRVEDAFGNVWVLTRTFWNYALG